MEAPDHDQGDAAGLLELRTSLGAAIKTGHPDKYSYYYMGLSDYELAILDQDNGKATDYIDAAEDALQAALKLDPAFAEAEALLGSSYGVEIGLHPFKGMYLGSRVSSHLDHATRLALGSPRVSLLQRISDYETPKAYGGDKQRAMAEFHAALAAFDTYRQPDDQAPDWERAETHVWLARRDRREGSHGGPRRSHHGAGDSAGLQVRTTAPRQVAARLAEQVGYISTVDFRCGECLQHAVSMPEELRERPVSASRTVKYCLIVSRARQ